MIYCHSWLDGHINTATERTQIVIAGWRDTLAYQTWYNNGQKQDFTAFQGMTTEEKLVFDGFRGLRPALDTHNILACQDASEQHYSIDLSTVNGLDDVKPLEQKPLADRYAWWKNSRGWGYEYQYKDYKRYRIEFKAKDESGAYYNLFRARIRKTGFASHPGQGRVHDGYESPQIAVDTYITPASVDYEHQKAGLSATLSIDDNHGVALLNYLPRSHVGQNKNRMLLWKTAFTFAVDTQNHACSATGIEGRIGLFDHDVHASFNYHKNAPIRAKLFAKDRNADTSPSAFVRQNQLPYSNHANTDNQGVYTGTSTWMPTTNNGRWELVQEFTFDGTTTIKDLYTGSTTDYIPEDGALRSDSIATVNGSSNSWENKDL